MLIAEVGLNHRGSIETAKTLIRLAKANGADVAKFQLYDTDKLMKPSDSWYGELKQAELSHEQAKELNGECERQEIEFMASCFDSERVEWCEGFKVKRYKIASRSVLDRDLLLAVLRTNKPMIISLGYWTLAVGYPFPILPMADFDFLYCVSKYPTPLEEINFNNIDFKQYSGFSDHTVGIEASLVAIARGAKIIEKHFTMDKFQVGPDHICSMTPNELRQLSGFWDKVSICVKQ